jgi:hypothetical protein
MQKLILPRLKMFYNIIIMKLLNGYQEFRLCFEGYVHMLLVIVR